jgi:ribosomal protein L32
MNDFNKWIKAVEEALETHEDAIFDPSNHEEIAPEAHADEQECDCGHWNCEVCFPPEQEHGVCPQCGQLSAPDHDCASGNEEICPECGDLARSGHVCEPASQDFEYELDEEPFSDSNKSWTKDENGQQSPLTFADLNLKEEPLDSTDIGDAGDWSNGNTEPEGSEAPEQHHPDVPHEEDNLENDNEEYEHPSELAGKIEYMQSMGLSSSQQEFSREDLARMSPDQLQSAWNEIMTGNKAPAFESKKLSESSVPKKKIIENDTTALNIIDELKKVDESTLSQTVAKSPSSKKLIQFLHKTHKLSNDAYLEPQPFNKWLYWKEVKEHPDNFVIIQFRNGVAAIKPPKEYHDRLEKQAAEKGKTYNPRENKWIRYEIIAFKESGERIPEELLQASANDDDIETKVDKSKLGGKVKQNTEQRNQTEVMAKLEHYLGQPVSVYTIKSHNPTDKHNPDLIGDSLPHGIERDKMAKRKEANTEPSAQNIVFNKVKPLINKFVMSQRTAIKNGMRQALDRDEDTEQYSAKLLKLKNLDSANGAQDIINNAAREAGTTVERLAKTNVQAWGPFINALKIELNK